jgi:hypothetical protein
VNTLPGLALRWRHLLALAFLITVTPALRAADTPDAGKVRAAISAFGEELGKQGKPRVEGDQLFFGATKINGDTGIVDAIKAKHGCSATVFARKGDSFVRVSTNVMRDGARALGTPLDAAGPAYAALSKGKPFRGVVDILGRMFDAGYEPVLGPKGEVVGAYYVGYALE